MNKTKRISPVKITLVHIGKISGYVRLTLASNVRALLTVAKIGYKNKMQKTVFLIFPAPTISGDKVWELSDLIYLNKASMAFFSWGVRCSHEASRLFSSIGILCTFFRAYLIS